MTHKTVHLHPDKLAHRHNVYLFLIPAIIFVFILIILFINLQDIKNQQIASTSEPTVLGEEVNEKY
jgi:hypothetical protein